MLSEGLSGSLSGLLSGGLTDAPGGQRYVADLSPGISYISTPLALPGGVDIDITVGCTLSTQTGNRALWEAGGYTGSQRGIMLRTFSNQFQIFSCDGTTSIFSNIPVPLGNYDGIPSIVRFVWDGTASKADLYVNGDSYESASNLLPWTGDTTVDLQLGAYLGLNGPFLGSLWNFDCKIDGARELALPLDGDLLDVSGNGNNGSWVGDSLFSLRSDVTKFQ